MGEVDGATIDPDTGKIDFDMDKVDKSMYSMKEQIERMKNNFNGVDMQGAMNEEGRVNPNEVVIDV